MSKKSEKYEREFGDYAEVIRQSECCACSKSPPSDPHHVRARGAGGTKKDLVPLCRDCHNTVHNIGIESFRTRYGIDLKTIARIRWNCYEVWAESPLIVR